MKNISYLYSIFFVGKPPSMNAWIAQCILYVGLMAIVKTCITLFMQLDFWENVKDFILSPINNPKIELAFVMLIIPFFVNVCFSMDTDMVYITCLSLQMLMFWVTDNFLMYKSKRVRRNSAEQSLLQKTKIQYRTVKNKEKRRGSDSEVLLSDDELLDVGSTTPLQRSFVTV